MTGNMVAETPFFDTHAGTLHELFVALDREPEWRDNPKDLLPYTQAKWVGSEHGNSAEKDDFTPDQEAAAEALMPELGLQQEILPPDGDYEQVDILGGMMRVNRERTGFVKRLLDERRITAGRIIFWAGQRMRDYRDDSQLERMDLEALAAEHEWVGEELAKPAGPLWEGGLATETALARLAYLEHFKHARLVSTAEASYTFVLPGYPDFTLMDCPAVERPIGPARATTDSCAAEWLATQPPSQDAQVLVVAGNPHILRNSRNIRNATWQHGREDIDLTVCGPAANPEASIQLYLGEIGRLLHMDVQAQVASSAS